MRSSSWVLVLVACGTPVDEPATCVSGLDANADGVCDSETIDWSQDASIPAGTSRKDLYGLGDELEAVRREGLGHAFVWPVEVSGMLLPWRPMANMLAEDASAEAAPLQALARQGLGFGTLPEMYAWLGLAPYQASEGAENPYAYDIPAGWEVGDPMGAGVIDTQWGEALTFSCATCHATSFFGRSVVGMTNREARANEFFHLATLFFPAIDAEVFASLTEADETETELFRRTQVNLPAVGVKVPEVAGLDTALAQVGLALARRNEDPYATRNKTLEGNPRPSTLDTDIADSKPAVWWNLKHKTRWLSDGSIVSGNPVFTNFLWNELGRATDLEELEAWMEANQRVIDTLTVAVFATEPPRWTDYFPAESIDLAAAKRGQALYGSHCASCHGTYEKAWDGAGADTLSAEALLATTAVTYHEQTPVMDVGTDLQRAHGMRSFADGLNNLAISAWAGTVVTPQEGYVPPPLEGIWARYPYLHHESVPTLCALLSPADQRPSEFWVGPTDVLATDFDDACVGYPVGEAVPAAWKEERRRYFDTSLAGLTALGHDSMLLDSEGAEILSAGDKTDLITFLKTL